MQKVIDKLNFVPKDYELWEHGFTGLFEGTRRRFYYLHTSDLFDKFIMLCVILNTVIMTTDGLVHDPAA